MQTIIQIIRLGMSLIVSIKLLETAYLNFIIEYFFKLMMLTGAKWSLISVLKSLNLGFFSSSTMLAKVKLFFLISREKKYQRMIPIKMKKS